MNPEQDCSSWSLDKKKIRGCGSNCECPRMTSNFDRWAHCSEYLTLIRSQLLTLDDIADVDWHDIQLIMIIEEEEKRKDEEHKQKIKELFGS